MVIYHASERFINLDRRACLVGAQCQLQLVGGFLTLLVFPFFFRSSGLYRIATRVSGDKSSVSNCSRLAANSEEMQVNPVALPPGRAMLATSLSSGSHAKTMMGIASVASLAARNP